MLRRAGLIAGALILVALLLLVSGHWILGVIFGAAAVFAVVLSLLALPGESARAQDTAVLQTSPDASGVRGLPLCATYMHLPSAGEAYNCRPQWQGTRPVKLGPLCRRRRRGRSDLPCRMLSRTIPRENSLMYSPFCAQAQCVRSGTPASTEPQTAVPDIKETSQDQYPH